MNVNICDRCRKIIPDDELIHEIRISNFKAEEETGIRRYTTGDRMEVCEACMKKIDEVLYKETKTRKGDELPRWK